MSNQKALDLISIMLLIILDLKIPYFKTNSYWSSEVIIQGLVQKPSVLKPPTGQVQAAEAAALSWDCQIFRPKSTYIYTRKIQYRIWKANDTYLQYIYKIL
jgi:hypothetical protein